MVVILDTGFIIALRNEDDQFHSTAKILMRKMLKGIYGRILINDYIFDEAVTLAMIRKKEIQFIKDLGKYCLQSERIVLINIGEDLFFHSWKLFLKYYDQKLSFTDCTLIAIQSLFEQPCFVATFDSPLKNLVNLLPGI